MIKDLVSKIKILTYDATFQHHKVLGLIHKVWWH